MYFVHENQPFPPSSSQFGEMRFATKSDLLSLFGDPGQITRCATFHEVDLDS